ncbi:MAG: OmpA family protein [Flavobacterium sp.]|uniref:OmpA family protein n=1 Tax=Flavobacterium sp. TaxID=239 RepID=UPI003BBF3FFE
MKLKIIVLFFLISFKSFGQKQIEVFFDFNKDVPNELSQNKINHWVLDNKNVEIIQVLGYCDSIDDSEYNKELAMRRVNTMIAFFNTNAIKINDNVELKSFGKDFNYSKNQSENRKVIISYLEPKSEISTIVNDSISISSLELSKIVDLEKNNLEAKFLTKSKGDLIRIYGIQFYLNSTKIIELSKPLLEELLRIMNVNPKLKIEIQGHICCQFVNDYSGLSSLRAKTIYNYLTQNNININRLRYVGFGSLKPIYKIPEQNEIEEQVNRRVEILILDN